MNKLITFLIVILLVPVVSAISLQDYPDIFVKNNNLEVTLIVGDLATASDTIGAVEIAVALQSEFFTNSNVKAVLASEIENIDSQNLIVVGGPCANSVAAELMNYPLDCTSPIQPNTGIINIYDFGKTSTILVAGSSATDTRRASTVLANYQDFDIPNSDSMDIINKQEKKVLIN